MPYEYKYLIVGGGMTADAAVKGIREIDGDGSIGVISSETDAPYKRPSLTKQLWKGKPVESIWLHTQDQGIDLHLGTNATSIDPIAKIVTDDMGIEHSYEKLLLATGGTPRRLNFSSNRIIYFQTFADYKDLRNLADTGDKFVVIGGGFIGSEIAAALAMNGKQVTMVFPDESIGSKIYPKDASAFLNDYYRNKGVELLVGDLPADVEEQGSKLIVKTKAGRELEADGVVAGIGITPNTKLAELVGLSTENGIVVNEMLMSSNPHIFAAGDVANFFNPVLNHRMRVEHEDNAVTMGRYAGRAMTGQAEPYHHIPYFYSDLFDLGYEAVGDLSSQLETFEDWKEPFQEGVIYYLKDSRVVGVLLWNVWEKVDEARALLAESGPFTADNLKGRIVS